MEHAVSLLDDLKYRVDGYLAGTYETYTPQGVPNPEDIPLGNKAAKFPASTLFVDVHQSSDITQAFRLQTAAKMMKAYFDGGVRIVNVNRGYVRSFNGDGMLALFRGPNRCDNAVKAAMQMKWFLQEVLGPRFKSYFSTNSAAVGQALEFDLGFGIDDGEIFAVRVGIKGTNDVAWVGRGTNTAAKLANLSGTPNSIWITRAVYEELSKTGKYSGDRHMWADEEFRTIGGAKRAIRKTTYRWKIG
jgi:class 3 adenylate cyclase